MSRIRTLPERDPTLDEREIAPLTSWLRTPSGTMTLRPIQARSLLETLRVRGLFLSGRVGCGKTLTAGLAARILDAKRPLLVTEASVVGDTIKLLERYRQHWHIPRINVVSYHKISRNTPAQQARAKRGEELGPGFLDDYAPDVVLLDEVHRLKRVRDAKCARRFARWFHGNQDAAVCAFSGTPIRDSLNDYGHILVWTLKRGAPVPLEPDVRAEWALLLDDEKPSREGYTQLPDWEILHAHLGEVNDQESARKAFQHRLLWTPGIVVSQDSFDAVPLEINPIKLENPPSLDEYWINLRTLYEAPDGWLLADKQLGVYSVACRLARGFDYKHVPRPPKDFVEARRDWCRFCRTVLETSTDLDTEVDVRNACISGRLPRALWDAWAAVKDTYEFEREAVWFSRHALHAAAEWGKKGGIIWCEYTAFARELAAMTGWPFFGAEGKDARGRLVGDARSDVDPTIIVSRRVAEVGKNLQGDGRPGYCRNLFDVPPRAAADWEQRLGRTHRDGQKDPVSCDYFVGCLEDFVAMGLSKSLAELGKSSLSPSQKLLRWDAREPPVEWAKGPAYGETSPEIREKEQKCH